MTIENNRITKIEGGDEATQLDRFLTYMKKYLGEDAYSLVTLHSGIHPQASVSPHQCPHILYRRLIEHSHSCNIHLHIGPLEGKASWPYWMHMTGDVRKATFKVGNHVVHDKGHLTTLDSPEVRAVAAKYPDRPGLEPAPRSF